MKAMLLSGAFHWDRDTNGIPSFAGPINIEMKMKKERDIEALAMIDFRFYSLSSIKGLLHFSSACFHWHGIATLFFFVEEHQHGGRF